jgi:adenylylsulfate kinase-like enzyme
MNNKGLKDSKVEVLFLTGQPGAGKSAVAREIGELLWRSREAHAIIDIDELCRGYFPTQTSNFNRSLAVTNLSAIWANFYAAGVRRLILARILESPDDLEQFGGAIPNAQITVCLLRVPADIVQRRLSERETGSARDFLLTVTTRIAERIADLDLPGVVVDNGQRPVNEVAREILSLIGWSFPPV